MDEIKKFKFLENEALRLGCNDARLIPADKVVVENRVRLKCMVGCPTYGKNLKCPPYTPSVEEFRRILAEYSFAMVVKLKGPELPSGEWSDFSPYYKDKLNILLELEKAAFNRGFNFATAFFAGRCKLCEECNMEGDCLNPITARFSAEAMGINVFKTAENAGIELKFDTENDPPSITLIAVLLID